MNSDLIRIEKGEPRVDSRLLARELQNQHKNVMELAERYAGQFERFGVVPFQTEKPAGKQGGRPERFALLNEDQSFFLLSLSRNTDHVVDLKAKLVMAFRDARHSQDLGAAEYLPGYHALHDKLHELSAGSTNEKHVHSNVNKLINKTIGCAAGGRKGLAAPAKALLIVAQDVAARALDGASDHHDGYVKAKQALGNLGQVLIGRAA